MSSVASFWHWPGWRQLGYALRLASGEMLLFLLVYGGSDWLTEQHRWRVAIHCRADLLIPVVPWTIAVYLSLNPLLWMAPFVLRTRRELQAVAAALAAATLAAGPFFLLLPAQDAFPALDLKQLGDWSSCFDLARTMAMRHNYLPSLHVAFTVIAASSYATRASTLGRVALGVWSAAILASTLLTHQHYLSDVATGLLFGWLAMRWVYRPMIERPEGQTPPANLPTYRERPA